MPVKDAIVLAGHQVIHNVQSFGTPHQHQVLRRVAKIAAIIHVGMGGAVEPTPGPRVDPTLDRNSDLDRFTRADRNFLRDRQVFEPLSHFDGHAAGRRFHLVGACRIENALKTGGKPAVHDLGVCRRIQFAIRRASRNARRYQLSGGLVADRNPDGPHGLLPMQFPCDQFPFRAPISLEQIQFRQSLFVRDVCNRLGIRGPAWMEVVVIAESQFIGLAARHRQHIKVVELVCRSAGRGVNHPLAIRRDVRLGPIKALLIQDYVGAGHGIRLKGHTPQTPGA